MLFCPRCSVRNEEEQNYCRQCGLPLQSIRLAAQGRSDQALTAYQKAGGSLAAGAITLTICTLIALINFFISSGPRNFGVLINLLLGLMIGLPLMMTGLVRMSRAERALKKGGGERDSLGRGSGSPEALGAGERGTDPLTIDATPSLPQSITEETTVKLKR